MKARNKVFFLSLSILFLSRLSGMNEIIDLGNEKNILHVIFSEDDRWAAIETKNNKAILFDLTKKKKVREYLLGDKKAEKRIKFCLNGMYIAIRTHDLQIIVINLENNQEVDLNIKNKIEQFKFSKAGKYLGTIEIYKKYSSFWPSIHIYELKRNNRFDISPNFTELGTYSIYFSPDEKHITAIVHTSSGCNFQIYNIKDARKVDTNLKKIDEPEKIIKTKCKDSSSININFSKNCENILYSYTKSDNNTVAKIESIRKIFYKKPRIINPKKLIPQTLIRRHNNRSIILPDIPKLYDFYKKYNVLAISPSHECIASITKENKIKILKVIMQRDKDFQERLRYLLDMQTQ